MIWVERSWLDKLEALPKPREGLSERSPAWLRWRRAGRDRADEPPSILASRGLALRIEGLERYGSFYFDFCVQMANSMSASGELG